MAAVLKTAVREERTVGSNPTLAAIFEQKEACEYASVFGQLSLAVAQGMWEYGAGHVQSR
jgi:hypothetical protein